MLLLFAQIGRGGGELFSVTLGSSSSEDMFDDTPSKKLFNCSTISSRVLSCPSLLQYEDKPECLVFGRTTS